MGSIGQDVKSNLKGVAKSSAKKAVQEPAEVLRSVPSQLSGSENRPSGFDSTQFYEKSDKVKESKDVDMAKVESQRLKMLRALEEEVAVLSRERARKDEERKSQATIAQNKSAETKSPEPYVSSKSSRKLKIGMQGKLDKMKKKSEIRMAPSG